MYVGFHKFVGQEIIQGFNLTMDEWTEFLTVMESTTEEVNESQPNTLHYTLHELIHLSYIYILEREIIARAHYNCFGCEQGAPGQLDHMESGCLSEWEDLVHQYYPEAVMAFSRPLFAEVCCKFRKMKDCITSHCKINIHFSVLSSRQLGSPMNQPC